MIKLFIKQFTDFLVVILIISAVISYFVGSALDAFAILAIVIINAIFGFVQEYKGEKVIEALKKIVKTDLKVVLRDGKKTQVSSRELVPGDVMFLEQGDRIPADIRLTEVANLQVDESILTGESTPVIKELKVLQEKMPVAERKNMLFSGTVITYGRCTGVVVDTAMNTEMAKIAKLIEEKEEETPLQKRLGHFGKQLGIAIIIISGVVTVIGFFNGRPLLDMFITGVALAVAAIPEGLPAVMTVTLGIGLHRMAKKNALIRRLAAVETLGSTTVICADKTGTLTKNEMTVKKIFLNGATIDVSGQGFVPDGKFFLGKTEIKNDRSLNLLLSIGALCNDATLQDHEGWRVIGDPTEGALIVVAQKSFNPENLGKQNPRVNEVPFDTTRKRMTTVNKTKDGLIAYTKGAPEGVLVVCNRVYRDGRISVLTESEKKKILDENQKLAEQALRVLGFAYKELGEKYDIKKVEDGLIFVGLMGMIDPPRAEVKPAMDVCKEAGIKVVMITGDHKATAMAIAKELGMSGEALTGVELDEMNDENLERIVENISIYARVTPEHKVRIVNAFNKKGHIVAMTGDGVNDAPALKKAQIGIAMGLKGSDVAKEASDMVLADDNFASIVHAIREGRIIYDNIRKFITYLLSSNSAEILIMFIGSFLTPYLPMIAVQLLWLNLLTDGLPALALGFEPPDPDIMKRKPRNPKEQIITKESIKFIIVVGILMAFVGLWNFIFELSNGVKKAQTIAFTALVMAEMFNALNSKSLKYSVFKVGLFSNKKLLLAIASSVVLQLAVVYLPQLQVLFGTVPLDLSDWTDVLIVSSIVLIAVEIWKFFIKK